MTELSSRCIIDSAKLLGRRLRIGRTYMRIRSLKQMGIPILVKSAQAKWKYSAFITSGVSLPSGPSDIEVHMLLNRGRLIEGIWAFYSFAQSVGRSCYLVVHDDGSLRANDLAQLHQVFPGCRIIGRIEADNVVSERCRKLNLSRCKQLRDTLIFALKLFDPILFTENNNFILIDSDVLFFSQPKELIASVLNSQTVLPNSPGLPRYSVDNGYRYCLDETQLASLLGQPCIQRFNPGVMSANRNLFSLARVESYLEDSHFWNADRAGNYYAELTLWAMELTMMGALPLPPTYAIAPVPDNNPQLISGHYCGGVHSTGVYYTLALPYAASSIRNPLNREGRLLL